MKELRFPFKNYALNNLIDFFKVNRIYKFSESNKDIETYMSENFEVQFYQERIPDFESEIQQIIETSIQETIDEFFTILAHDIDCLNGMLNRTTLFGEVEKWNNEQRILVIFRCFSI